MIEKVKGAIARYNMPAPGERVLAALSGGADSTALLLILKELGYAVFAVHVNHNLRGEESLRDQHFCEELCNRLEVPIFIESVDVKSYCEKNKRSVELGARELRYQALRKHANGCQIATAHTLSDVFETTVFNLTRGCGVKGLSGIPPVRDDIIRPLIDCTRAEIEKYLSEKGQDYITDSTNLEADCSRNIIRLNVIPELEKINPGLMKSFNGTLKALREADEFIDSAAEKLLSDSHRGDEYDFSCVSDDAVLSRAVAKLLQAASVEPSFERICAVKGLIVGGSGRINLKKGVYFKGCEGRLTVEYDAESVVLCQNISLKENAVVGGKRIIVTKISPFDILNFNKDELKYLFDEAKIAEVYTVRNYLGSEKIRLPGRGITSVIKKLLAGLTPAERCQRLVIADGGGAVFVEGIGVSERVCCTESTVSAIRIEITEI